MAGRFLVHHENENGLLQVLLSFLRFAETVD